MITDKNLSDDVKFLKELNQKRSQILDDMEVKCQRQRDAYLANIEEKAKEKKRRMISRTKSDVENQEIVKKYDILKKFKSEVMDAVAKETSTENYKLHFKDKFASALGNVVDENDLVIGIKADDSGLVPSKFNIVIDEQLLGGFYIIKGNRVKYDYSLNSEVDRIDDYLGCLINSLFDTVGEACDGAE